MKIRVYHNADDVFSSPGNPAIIPQCRGFALFRRRNGVEEIVSTWVGFEQSIRRRTARFHQLADPEVSMD